MPRIEGKRERERGRFASPVFDAFYSRATRIRYDTLMYIGVLEQDSGTILITYRLENVEIVKFRVEGILRFISRQIIPSSNSLKNNIIQRMKRKHEYNYEYILNFAWNNHGTRVSSRLPSPSSPFSPTILPTPTLSLILAIPPRGWLERSVPL